MPVSPGTIVNLERKTSAALARPHREILQAGQRADVKNVDETSWKKAGQKRWLWVAVTGVAIFFSVKLRRSAEALRSFLGEKPKGVVGSDRFSAYGFLPEGQRQACWAHLKRDFQAMAERAGKAKEVGEGLLGVVTAVFGCWRLVRTGKRSRAWFAKQVEQRWRGEAEGLLLRGLSYGCEKREDGRDVLQHPGDRRGVVDVRVHRGGRADKQRGGAGAADGGDLAEEVVWQPVRGGL